MTESSENKARYYYLDVLRVIALVCMSFILTYETLEAYGLFAENVLSRPLQLLIGVFYLFTPTVFMFCMGASAYLQKGTKLGYFFSHGIALILIGVIFNALRGGAYVVDAVMAKTNDFTEFYLLLCKSNILYFAGLFYLLLWLFKLIRCDNFVMLIVSIGGLVCANYIPKLDISNIYLNRLYGNIVRVDSNSVFAFVSWFAFPVLGYVFQMLYEKAKSKHGFVLGVSFVSGIVLSVFAVICRGFLNTLKLRHFLWGVIGKFVMDVPAFIPTASILLFFVSFIWFLSAGVSDGSKFAKFIGSFSSNVTKIYCISWFTLTYAAYAVTLYMKDFSATAVWYIFAIGGCVFVFASLVAALVKAIFTKKD